MQQTVETSEFLKVIKGLYLKFSKVSCEGISF